MKWAVVIARIAPERIGGISSYVADYTNILSKIGEEVHVITTTHDDKLPETEYIGQVCIHRLYFRTGDLGPLRFRQRKVFTDFFNAIDCKIRFDVLSVQAALSLETRLLRKDLFISSTVHGVSIAEYLYDLKSALQDFNSAKSRNVIFKALITGPLTYYGEYIYLSKARMIVVMSLANKKLLIRYFPWISESNIYISAIGVNYERFMPSNNRAALRSKYGISETELLFVTTRRLAYRMGLEQLLEGLKLYIQQTGHTRSRLIITGDGYLRDKLQRLVQQLGLENNVRMMGFVSGDVLVELYQISDAFIMSSQALEGFGISTIEALAVNLPVIATPYGANMEVVSKFCPELVANSGTASDLAERMVYFSNNLARYRNGEYRQTAMSIYSWDKIIHDLVIRTILVATDAGTNINKESRDDQ